jgi:tetratricopeptide (TPR) repeat protein
MDNLQSGIAAFKNDKREEARKYLIAAVKENPKDENAWGWLYQVANNDNERIECLKKVTAINPNNEKAKQLLNKLLAPPLTSTPEIMSPPQQKKINLPSSSSKQVASPKIETKKGNGKVLNFSIAIVVSLCLVCLVAAIAINTPAPSQSTAPTLQANNTSLEPIEQLKILVADALGTSNREVPRLSDVSWDSSRSEIAVTFAAQDNLSEDMIKRGVQMDIVNILRTIQTSNTSLQYKSIVAVATFSLVDVYGNSKESNIVIATYTRENLNKINWDNFLTDDIYLIANQDSLFIHPAARP